MNHTELRKRLRAVLAGSKCLPPASVHDALSARVAEAVGFEIGLLAGSVVATTTDYGGSFVSSVWRDNVVATQFHPEKSQKIGLQLLSNFAAL